MVGIPAFQEFRFRPHSGSATHASGQRTVPDELYQRKWFNIFPIGQCAHRSGQFHLWHHSHGSSEFHDHFGGLLWPIDHSSCYAVPLADSHLTYQPQYPVLFFEWYLLTFNHIFNLFLDGLEVIYKSKWIFRLPCSSETNKSWFASVLYLVDRGNRQCCNIC